MGAFATSTLLHALALGVALVVFASTRGTEPERLVLQTAAVEFHAAEVHEDESETALLVEDLPFETELDLPEELLPPDAPSEPCELPKCEFPVLDAAEPPPSVDIPLTALSERPPPRPAAPPATVPAPAPARPAQPVARPAPTPRKVGRTPASKGRPLKLLHRPPIMNYYPAEARRRGIEGEALVEIQVNARGVVTDARLVRSSGSALLDRQALRLLYEYRFAPGDGGKARVPVRFRLR